MPAAKRESIQKAVEREVQNLFFMEEALLEKVVNLRAAAKKIRPKVRQGSIEAIAIALRRYGEKSRRETRNADAALAALLARSRIRTRTDVADFTLESGGLTLSKVSEIVKKIKPGRGEILHVVFGEEATTIVVDGENYGLVKKACSSLIIEERKNLSEISIMTAKKVENAVGWVALISRLLARNGINMVETLSCYTETIFLVEEADLGRTLEVIRKARGS
jgi:hypothetical protein